MSKKRTFKDIKNRKEITETMHYKLKQNNETNILPDEAESTKMHFKTHRPNIMLDTKEGIQARKESVEQSRKSHFIENELNK